MTAERLRLRKEHMETIYKLEQERNLKEKLEKEFKENAQNLHARKEVNRFPLVLFKFQLYCFRMLG